jgi:hypothetical protein
LFSPDFEISQRIVFNARFGKHIVWVLAFAFINIENDWRLKPLIWHGRKRSRIIFNVRIERFFISIRECGGHSSSLFGLGSSGFGGFFRP